MEQIQKMEREPGMAEVIAIRGLAHRFQYPNVMPYENLPDNVFPIRPLPQEPEAA